MSTATVEVVRDLDADLAIATGEQKSDGILSYILTAIDGWPYAILRAQEAERENDRLRKELDALRAGLYPESPGWCYD